MIPPTLIAVIVSAAIGAGGAWAWQSNKYERQLSELRTQHATAQTRAEKARASLEAARRQTEQDLNNAQETHAKEVAVIRAEVDAARAAGRIASIRVRDAARATAQLASQVCADSTATAVRTAAADAADLLAFVLSEFEQQATALAGVADERGIAGAACAKLYDETRAKVNAAL